MPKRRRRSILTRHISIILDAIARVEGWDGPHASIRRTRDGGWKFDTAGCPVPTGELLREIAEAEQRAEGRA